MAVAGVEFSHTGKRISQRAFSVCRAVRVVACVPLVPIQPALPKEGIGPGHVAARPEQHQAGKRQISLSLRIIAPRWNHSTEP